jgi:methyltransferase
MIFSLFISFIILLRISELLISKRNEKWLLQNGAVEYGKDQYLFMIILHSLFIVTLIFEYLIKQPLSYNLFFIILYFLLISFKVWIIFSLGTFWNTKIYRISKMPLIKKGPYKYFKHPNYFIVTAEIAVIPLAFNLYYTAITFALLNMIMLFIRIKEENKILQIQNPIKLL